MTTAEEPTGADCTMACVTGHTNEPGCLYDTTGKPSPSEKKSTMPGTILVTPPIPWEQIEGHPLLDGHLNYASALRLVGPTMRGEDGVAYDEVFIAGPVDEIRVAAWPIGDAEIRQARSELQQFVEQFPDRAYANELHLDALRGGLESQRRLNVGIGAGPAGLRPWAVLTRPAVTWVVDGFGYPDSDNT